MAETYEPAGYCIGDLTLDLVHRQIRRRGEVLPCGKLTFDLLVLLARCAPSFVSREELAERLWRGRFVSSDTIKRRITLLRKALGERAEDPRYVQVNRGYGYGLSPDVKPFFRRPADRGRLPLLAVAACSLLAAFVIGAEVGYQDGLKPQIPDLVGAQSVIVVSAPLSEGDRELPGREREFVMGMARQVLHAIDHAGFIDSIDKTDSLTLMANATLTAPDSLNVTLALLDDSRPDFRMSRMDEFRSWSLALQRTPQLASLSSPDQTLENVAARYIEAASSEVSAPDQVFLIPRAASLTGNFLLVASFNLNVDSVHESPASVQSDAAALIRQAIDEQNVWL